MSDSRASFGDLLRRLRTAAALSQEDLAERAGLSRHGISDLERGARHAPRLETVRMLADALALSEPDRQALLTAARPALLGNEPPIAPPASLGSWPAPLTRLIGRQTELAALSAGLRDAAVRLLTVTGPGGVGKTRLAIAAAAAMQDAFADGLVFVDLSPLTDAALVLPTIAGTLGVQAAAGQPLMTTLATFAGTKRLLLLLDNCEPVLEAASDVATLLVGCPGLTILATSREPWRVRGEQEFPLPPLPLPPADRLLAIEAVQGSPAVALFVERARAVQPDFALTAETALAVAAICRRLDGLPLAIELAAARVKALPPAALLTRLQQRLPLLTGGGRDLPARQRTMRDTIAWSSDLLTPEEQRLFSRLAVFVGGCTLEAAEAVCATDDDSTYGVLEGVASLIDKSLLREDHGSGGEPRYLMLETVREFALEQLQTSGEEGTIRMRHATWCLALAEQMAPRLRGSGARGGFAGLEREHGNLRAGLAWFEARGAVQAFLGLAAALGYFWSISGHWTEGNAWLERALAADPRPSLARLEALENLGENAGYQGDIARAEAALQEGLALARQLGAAAKVSAMLNCLGAHRVDQGRYEEGLALLTESVDVAQRADDTYGEALSLAHLGIVAWGRGDLAEASALLEAAQALGHGAGLPFPTAVAAHYLGLVAWEVGDFARAAAGYRDWIAYAPEALHILARAALDVASLAAAQGEGGRAARLFGAAAVLTEAIGLASAWPERGLHERAIAGVRAALGDDAYDVAFDAGRRLPREHVLAEVEAVLDAATAPRVIPDGR